MLYILDALALDGKRRPHFVPSSRHAARLRDAFTVLSL